MRQAIGSPLVVQIGHERGTAFLLKHPGELEQRTRIDRNVIAGRVSLCAASACCRGAASRRGSPAVRAPLQDQLQAHEGRLARLERERRETTTSITAIRVALGMKGAKKSTRPTFKKAHRPDITEEEIELYARERRRQGTNVR